MAPHSNVCSLHYFIAHFRFMRLPFLQQNILIFYVGPIRFYVSGCPFYGYSARKITRIFSTRILFARGELTHSPTSQICFAQVVSLPKRKDMLRQKERLAWPASSCGMP